MKKKILFVLSKAMSIVTVISTIIFMIVNFENLAFRFAFSLPTKASKSLHVKYQYWLEDIYGRQRGLLIWRKIRDTTVWIINHHINEMFFAVIILMMMGTIWVNKKLNKKMSKLLKVYLIFCILLMLWTIFIVGPFYIKGLY